MKLKAVPLLLLPTALMLVLVGCGDSQALPDIEATVEARIEEHLAAIPIPTPTPMSHGQGSPTNSPGFSKLLLVGQPPPNTPPYRRGDWRHWVDEDADCQNTRAEVLIEESVAPVTFQECRVVSGQWLGPYTGITETSASSLDVDHMVPLANAHRSGGWAWGTLRKRAYANDLNDPDHLIAVTASANRSKGADGPEDWRPPDKTYWCEYALDWARIKEAWGLSVTQDELHALQEMVGTCSFKVELASAGAPVLPSQVFATPMPFTVSGAVVYDPDGPDRDCGDFTTWGDAQAFYYAAGGPESDPHRLDGDKDKIACEGLADAP